MAGERQGRADRQGKGGEVVGNTWAWTAAPPCLALVLRICGSVWLSSNKTDRMGQVKLQTDSQSLQSTPVHSSHAWAPVAVLCVVVPIGYK